MKKSLTGLHLFQSKQISNSRWRGALAALFISAGLSEAALAQNKVWDKTLGGSKPEKFEVMVPTSDGGYLLGGSSVSGISGDKSQPNKGKEDYWIVKTNNNGQKLWDKVYGGSDNDHLTAIVPTSDGGYLLGGYSASGVSGDKTQAAKGGTDYWLIKIDANGKKVWDKVYGGNEADNLTALISTPDG
ncbi:MAG: hypothetical protein M3Q05_02640, partial [Bacteroidota bacterium]|nr:hypothetical protein [Bacteroidota bacterium]